MKTEAFIYCKPVRVVAWVLFWALCMPAIADAQNPQYPYYDDYDNQPYYNFEYPDYPEYPQYDQQPAQIAPQGQQQYPPVDLYIQNIAQQTITWCWAAVAQQIIFWKRNYSPNQCELVAIAYNANAQYCCTYPQACTVTGSLEQIQALIMYYGGSFSAITPPADPYSLYQTLAAGRAVILALQSTPFSGHVVVVRGMEWVQTAWGMQPVLYINDPMSYFSKPVPFYDLLGYWQAAIVVF
ncbi:hypothetical protein C7N43_21815 [Sphingobacteriales bacterium UPWRP_1]|nr:hypothetical protein BVG80_16230 [Sphingobacteriales bacterium TSM_CSM]PSJ74869.1 hypothetical protein C7N43_21815 [Sphingobacteriales bacterium UPWRP_1]